MIDGDQAEGLRRWAKTLSVEPPSHAAPRTLMVLGLDCDSGSQRVTRVLQHWQAQGYDWVGDPARWRVRPVRADDARLPALAALHQRWGLWVDEGPEGICRAFAQLRGLSGKAGPRHLLALHHPHMPRRGRLENLRRAALERCGVKLLLIKA
ncbi:hypothetical protein [Parahaliea aestuarii]|uniref:Uncharacterized protein n=1 Tax=Parahaliea aestuarii TaxID=1852021 RepID=A0A5C9A506_9GAMM|nr:hypothetical protein [Parahaliea aestuarii]TXS94810.1 hypothetical protein FVW59_02570 [Parahaliea aestuarii]